MIRKITLCLPLLVTNPRGLSAAVRGGTVFFGSLPRPVFERGQMGDDDAATHARAGEAKNTVGLWADLQPFAARIKICRTLALQHPNLMGGFSLCSTSRHYCYLSSIGAVHGCGNPQPQVAYRTFRADAKFRKFKIGFSNQKEKNTNRGQITKLN